jgi:hypothetical protein
METKSAMIICNSQVAKELIEMDENFKQVICICPWLDDDANNDSVLVVDKSAWDKLVDAGDVFLREEVAGVKKNEDD